MLSFGPFRLDILNACVWRGTEILRPSPKAGAILRILVEQAGQLVSKERLLQEVWPDVTVSDAALTVCIGDLRRLLGDSARAPQFIETVHRHGYRFIAPVTRTGGQMQAKETLQRPRSVPPRLVGRQTELRRLHDALTTVQNGERQVVFITGEPGIGKTTLLDTFVAQVTVATPLWTARGQCIAHYGASEAYLPVLEALEQLCREADGEQVLAQLERYAPTWLVHMPSLLSPPALEALQRKVQGGTPERMLREIADALEALTSLQPLILVLEDLHWSDMATLDLLTWLARRRQTARLLLLGTYRPVDVIVRQHPLRVVTQELALQNLGAELPLELLNQAEIGQYLTDRCREQARPETLSALSSLLYQRTEGNPLLLSTLVESLERQGSAWDTLIDVEEALREVPPNLRGLVEQQLTQCSVAERQVLEAASIAGVEFAASSVPAALATTREGSTIEAVCEELVRREQFLADQGLLVWPDGTITQKFGFRHALYREVLYSNVAEARRARLHRAIGEQLESGYAGHTEKIAGELAAHFANGQDDAKAIAYHQLAAEVALKRSAPREAIRHLEQGLAAVERLPASPAQAQHDLRLHTRLGAALIAAHGYSAPEVEHTFARAWEMCQQIEDHATLAPVLCGLWRFYTGRADLPRATKLATQLFTLTQQQREPGFLLEAHSILGQTRLFLGELAAAQVHVDHNLALYDARTHRSLIDVYGEDPGVVCRGYGAGVKWLLGAPDQARRLLDEGLQLAQDLGHPECMAQQLWAGAFRYQWCGDVDRVHELTQQLLGLNPDEISPVWRAGGAILQGWVWRQRGQMAVGMAQMRQGLDEWQATGMVLYQPYFLALLAEALGEQGEVTEGLEVLAAALTLVEKTEERWYEAELYRLQGELILQSLSVPTPYPAPRAEAEACFRKALDITGQQEAKSLELRAATSLARLWQSQGKHQEAHDVLAPVYGWFMEGFDTADLKDAKLRLEELA